MLDTDTDGAAHVYPAVILFIFWYVFRELAHAYPHAANGAVPVKILVAVESVWSKLSENSTKKTLHKHSKIAGSF